MAQRHGMRQELSPARGDHANYVTSMYDFMELQSSLKTPQARRALARVSEDAFLASHETPIELGISNRGEFQRKLAAGRGERARMPFRALDNQLKPLRGRPSVKVGILNGFGTGQGDTLVGLTAFEEVRKRMGLAGIGNLEVELWVRPNGYDNARAVCDMHRGIDRVEMLPMPIGRFQRLGGFWDLGGLVDRPTVGRRCMVDFFLELMGVEPTGVPREDKRNRLSLSIPIVKDVGDATREKTERYVILHPLSENARQSMPAHIFRDLCTRLVQATGMDVASLVPMRKMHERHVDLSAISRRGFEHHCALIKNAAGLVTVDTSTYHVADAFSVPTVVIFSTSSPELGTPYYPTVSSVELPGLEDPELPGSDAASAAPPAPDPLKLWGRLNLDEVTTLLQSLRPHA